MDPPPLPPLPTTAAAAAATTTPTSAGAGAESIHLSHPETLDYSPCSRAADPWASDEPLAPVPGAKLRLMCSYGGHIIPRPHDKSLCYVGGDTRIVVVDRHSSLSDLCARLSKTLLHGRPFTLKYQLPSEDLDSLISVTTDEDLDNMIDEYDRTAAASPLKPSRLRLFLFFVKPETAASMGALLDDAKSETWFVDALNGSGLLPRGLSDSAVEDCLLSLDGVRASDSCGDLEAQGNSALPEKSQPPQKPAEVVHYGYAAPDSPLVENNSSFGSSSSSPSMSNLPPIRVRVAEEARAATIEEQFAQISFGPPVTVHSHVNVPQMMVPAGDNVSNKVLSDDERSDHGGGGGGGGNVPVGFRKPPLPMPLQPVQMNKGGYGLPSPDSVASDTSSITSASSLAKPLYYQDQQQQQHYAPPRETRAGPASPDTRTSNNEASAGSDPNPGAQFQAAKADPGGYFLPSPHLDQHHHQQFHPAGAAAPGQCMIHHHHVPMTAPYYQVYPQSGQQFHHQLDQQYPPPVYMVAAQTPQPYTMPDHTTATAMVSSTRPGPPGIPPVYPPKTASPAPSQFPPHYGGFSHHPAAVASSAGPAYAYEYSTTGPAAGHEHVFYSAAPAAAPMPSHYQSMTPAAAMALSEAAKQLQPDTNNAPPQLRTS